MAFLRKTLRRILRVLLWLSLFWLVFAVVLVIFIHFYGTIDRAQPADVIIVLGAGVKVDGSPDLALTRRTLHAAELWERGLAPKIICTGSKAYKRPRSEAEACQELLINAGVPSDAILLETRSRSTQENAIYAHDILRDNGWQTALIVTDSYHMFRSHLIFQHEGYTFSESPVPFSQIPDALFYLYSILREVAALHWLIIVWVLNLPVTYIALI